jgi:hypothetical protein
MLISDNNQGPKGLALGRNVAPGWRVPLRLGPNQTTTYPSRYGATLDQEWPSLFERRSAASSSAARRVLGLLEKSSKSDGPVRKFGWPRCSLTRRLSLTGRSRQRALFTPFRVGALQLTNRIVIAPMCDHVENPFLALLGDILVVM